MYKGIAMSNLKLALLKTFTRKNKMTSLNHSVIGTHNFFRPKSIPLIKLSIDIKVKAQTVTRLPIPGSSWTKSSMHITAKQQPTRVEQTGSTAIFMEMRRNKNSRQHRDIFHFIEISEVKGRWHSFWFLLKQTNRDPGISVSASGSGFEIFWPWIIKCQMKMK